MIYTAGQRERIMHMVKSIHTVENILAASDMDELYAYGHADPIGINALTALACDAPEWSIALSNALNGHEWMLSIGDTTLASGSVIVGDDVVIAASSLTPGKSKSTAKDMAPSLSRALKNAAFEQNVTEIGDVAYAEAAPVTFSIATRALMQFRPVFEYLKDNGSIRKQASDMLGLIDAAFEGTLYKNETGDAFYIETSAKGMRVFGTLTGGESVLTLLISKGNASLNDAEVFREGVKNGSIDGMALTITESDSMLDIDGVSTNYGLLHAPRARFTIRGEHTSDTARYTVGALGIDVCTINISNRDAESALSAEDLTDGANAAEGLTALAQQLTDIAPLVNKSIADILKN